MKKLTLLIAMAAVLAFVGNAAAATYKINLAGASAQAKFWRTAASAFLSTQLGCTQTSIAEFSEEKDGIVQGTGCGFPSAGDSNTVQIAYLAIASYAGCENAPGCLNQDMADPSTCNFVQDFDNPGACTGQTPSPVHLGASDVPCECLSQTSKGYEDGYDADASDGDGSCGQESGALPNPGGDPNNWQSYGPYDNALPARMTQYASVAVPFGFIVNDSVQMAVCTNPGTANEDDIAYDPTGNECDPSDPAPCQGYADCDKASKTCLAGVNAGNSCSDPEECPLYDNSEYDCVKKPLKNLSRIKLVAIFSGAVTKWSDFGPAFDVVAGHDDLPGPSGWNGPHDAQDYVDNDTIVACMRHAGSGTHATMENVVMRSDASLINKTDCDRVFHYRSSSDLTEDCVQRFPGSIGYVDADKILGKDDTQNIHVIKYQGVSPNRFTIANCEYPFFAEQQTFYDPDCVDNDLDTLADDLNAFAAIAANLNDDDFGAKADFWATQDELLCSKGTTCGGCGLLPQP